MRIIMKKIALTLLLTVLTSPCWAGFQNYDCWNNGNQAAPNATTGTNNVACGALALQKVTTGDYNVGLGNKAGSIISTGSGNVIVGYNAAATLTTGSNNVIIGNGLDVVSASSASYTNINGIAGYGTKPTVASGFGTTPTVPSGTSTFAFTVNVGTGAAATGGVLTMPAAPTGWACNVDDITTPAGNSTRMTAQTATTVTFTNYSRTTGIAAAWPASDILAISCNAY